MSRPTYSFLTPEEEEEPIIKVVGVGGAGSHAVRTMAEAGIRGVKFMVINTDRQALRSNTVENKLQIGQNLTRGLGAGSDSDMGEAAARESREEIRNALDDGSAMVFITAGLGGGTGTGASPIVAEIAKELGMLTVGIVTLPLSNEGTGKMVRALKGVSELKKHCDSVLVILTDKVVEIFGKLGYGAAFRKANEVLMTAAKSIAEIITVEGHPNVDFNDVRTIMTNSRTAIMGSAIATSEEGPMVAAEQALESPLLNNMSISGAKYILVGISYGAEEPSMEDMDSVFEAVQKRASFNAELKYSAFPDPSLGDKMEVTIIATGFADDDPLYGYTIPEESAAGFAKPISTTQVNRHATREVTPQAAASQPLPVQERAPLPKVEPVIPPQQVAPRPIPQAEPVMATAQREVMDLSGKLVAPLGNAPAEDPTERIFAPDYDANRAAQLQLERQQRIERQRRLAEMKAMGVSGISAEAMTMLSEPAYKRKDIELSETAPKAQRQVSRTTLNQDNELSANNRFLHDNVD